MANHTRAETLNRIARDATTARYKSLPPLPTQQELTKTLRELNGYLDGPDSVSLGCINAGYPDAVWGIGNDTSHPGAPHCEQLPGNGKPFDAAAAARRLLSEARLAGFR